MKDAMSAWQLSHWKTKDGEMITWEIADTLLRCTYGGTHHYYSLVGLLIPLSHLWLEHLEF